MLLLITTILIVHYQAKIRVTIALFQMRNILRGLNSICRSFVTKVIKCGTLKKKISFSIMIILLFSIKEYGEI